MRAALCALGCVRHTHSLLRTSERRAIGPNDDHYASFRAFLLLNAQAVWAVRTRVAVEAWRSAHGRRSQSRAETAKGPLFGLLWHGPPTTTNAVTHTSGLDALIAAAAVA